MKIGLSTIAERLRGSLWFVPSVMAVAAALLAWLMIQLDESFRTPIEDTLAFIYTGGPTGARAILSTTAGSMITIAGVSFSVVIVALALASNQFGPRLLRNFMRDRGNQLVLGTFIATYIYCLLILGTIRSEEGAEFVPYLAVTAGLAMALLSLSVLIYFIHHVSESIQADHVVMVVADELDHSIEKLFPEQFGEKARKEPEWTEEEWKGWSLSSPDDGYLQAIDPGKLLTLARDNDLRIDLRSRPGMFLTRSTKVGEIHPAESETDSLREHLAECFVVGPVRTIQQDVGFAIEQLVEVAVRSLSPSLNDPFTARGCLDRLLQGLIKLVDREFPSQIRYSDDGKPRLRAPATDLRILTDLAFDPIRHYGATSPLVIEKLVEILEDLVEAAPDDERREILIRHAEKARRTAETSLEEETSLRRISEALGRMTSARADGMPRLLEHGSGE